MLVGAIDFHADRRGARDFDHCPDAINGGQHVDGHDRLRAFSRQPQRRRSADPTSRRGDDDNLSGKSRGKDRR